MNSELIIAQIDKIVAQMDDLNAALKQLLEDDNVY
jgi:outer membrane murein-binding lipoprotein Lpp